MAITYDGGTGLFDVLGGYAKTALDVRDDYQAALETRLELHLTLRAAGAQQPAAALLAKLEAYQAGAGLLLADLEDAGYAEIQAALEADTGAVDTTKAGLLDGLRLAMERDSETLTRTAGTATPTADAGNTGTGKLVASVYDGDGNALQFMQAETIVVECVVDGQQDGAALAGGELWRVRGEPGRPRSSPLWGTGSGAVGTMRTASADRDCGTDRGMNILRNADYEVFSSNLPLTWSKAAGTAGVHIASSATANRGALALAFTGDGTTNPAVRQQLGAATQTPRTLKPRTRYAIGGWVRHGGAAPATGTVRLRIADSGGTTLDSGNAAATLNAATASGTYQFFSATFSTGDDVPATVYLYAETSSALDSGKTVLLDDVVVQEMVQAYPGGPMLALFAGDTDFVVGDRWTVAVANGNTTANLCYALDYLLGCREHGVQLPGAGSGTISDGVLA